MIRIVVALGLLVSLAGCSTATVGGQDTLSGMSPPAPYARNSIPEPATSLPVGAQGVGAKTAFVPPNYASITFVVPRL